MGGRLKPPIYNNNNNNNNNTYIHSKSLPFQSFNLQPRERERERMMGMVMLTRGGGGCGGENANAPTKGEEEENQEVSLVALLIAALRKSMVACHRDDSAAALHQMEIGWPTNVQHLAHVTFDRFHGFLGLPVEFQVEIPCRVPSARSDFLNKIGFIKCTDLGFDQDGKCGI